MSKYEKRAGVLPVGTDKLGRTVWRIRGRVEGLSFDERYHGTKTDANRRYRELSVAAAKGTLAQATGETVGEFLDAWVDHRVKLGKISRGRSEHSVRGRFRNHVVPVIGTKR